MSNDPKNCRPLRTEWVPVAYRDDKVSDELIKPIERSVVEGFEKKVLKKGLIKKLR
ncbi:hypothetical protein LJ707_05715 [Mucilaginibacter sp. UR6-1]|uniref:hypothetical protein n=1 Tax=Mucilaginibacter sp. UR6-1 TaxID=1435643 RepID=UPI001E40DAF9|nr:hypothetical protein [Mucilaginibacter sp. UR6-1]MCC8408418.1 hypothetical protein [Mucilaginibacter sp. UR6-1]